MSDGLFLTGKQIETFDMVLPKHTEGPFLAPFRAGGLTIEGTFDIELYPGAFERLDEMIRNHPDYCAACEGFPCRGDHPTGEEDHG
jgi:hypothetical protein